ncbi:uncharacterized protein UV8b_01817 [Ustilaginoidea virens]|uniref:Uncharacterized protein n=1 Tax=Ustilaginoidea virens TaxID=1159556 RepID=A0A8E5HLD2_USTVR|nr:uncharacterized protein UV8b_01817 [Ustilaginoidea virens]QUC17576.1 hypothetical protein UV8b_01817 [Ustilaginoidea virens]
MAEALEGLVAVMAPEQLGNSLGNKWPLTNQFLSPPTVITERSFLMAVTAHRINAAC